MLVIDGAPAHPAFAPYADIACALGLARGKPALADLTACARELGLENAHGLPLRFVDAGSEKRAARDYERHALETGCLPTRADTWHDVLNALVWLRFPRLKAALNATHVAACAEETGPVREPRRDALTLLDESGILVTGPSVLSELLAAHDWQALFVTRRGQVAAQMAFVVVGHALLEKALAPWPGVTGKCLALGQVAEAEAAAIAALPRLCRPATLSPLPICGVPGWDPANADAVFYDDTRVFRPHRRGAQA